MHRLFSIAQAACTTVSPRPEHPRAPSEPRHVQPPVGSNRTNWWVAAALGVGFAAVVSGTDAAEATLATSPLVGAETVDERGVGTVHEVLPAGSYTYFRLVDDPRWFVTTRAVPEPGSAVAWTGFAATESLHSRRLDRQFHHLVFASIDAPETP